ncbi:MAG: hypothetical protein E7059_02535 [Treponema bryantii]|nr:hypothetical protein [Treponema bryantii]
MRVKSKIGLLLFSIALISFSSCATTKNATSTQTEKKINKTQKYDLEEQFISEISNISIESLEIPKPVIKGRKFKSDFKSIVKNAEGNPVANFPVQLKFPISKVDGKIEYSTLLLHTSEDGTISFNPESTSFSCDTFIELTPAIPETLNIEYEKLIEAVAAKTLKQSIKIKSDIINKGAVLFVWEHNEKGRPTSNSYTMLSELRRNGVALIGNAPVSDTSFIGKPLKELYDANYEVIGGTMYGYLLYGTIKFEVPVTKVDDGYTCTLVAEIVGIDMKNGETTLTTSVSCTATGSNWNNCVSNCKSELTTSIVNNIIYGL